MASHRRSLLIALLALFSLILIAGDRVTTTPATIALLVLAIGIAAIVYLQFAKPQPVTAGAVAMAPPVVAAPSAAVVAERPVPQQDVPPIPPEPQAQPASNDAGTPRSPSITISLELPEGDLTILRQIAVLLRESN